MHHMQLMCFLWGLVGDPPPSMDNGWTIGGSMVGADRLNVPAIDIFSH